MGFCSVAAFTGAPHARFPLSREILADTSSPATRRWKDAHETTALVTDFRDVAAVLFQ